VPFTERHLMDLRLSLVRRYLAKEASMIDLCMEYNINPKTGHKWVARFFEGGTPNLVDRSRAPHSQPYAVAEDVVVRVLELRQRHPSWGPKKLRAWLLQHEPKQSWPAASTIGDLLLRRGLIEPRRPASRRPYATPPAAAWTEPNVVWCADFKGWIRVGHEACHPLTITDGYSRYLLRCHGMRETRTLPVQQQFEASFREYGMPLRLRTDNGSPFASKGVGGLSRLSVGWVKLGITPERIVPGKPQQNGRHERMHRTLKAETMRPGASQWDSQQKAFDRFRQEYNHDRPHEALGQKTPGSLYVPSLRRMPDEPTDPVYPPHFVVRRVGKKGCVHWNCGEPSVGVVLAQELVGFEPLAQDRYQLWFGPVYLGLLLEKPKGKHTLIKNLLPTLPSLDATP
jgi:putative transposase